MRRPTTQKPARKVPSFAEQFVEHALNFGAFEFIPEGRKLKNGRISPYFFNSGKFDSGRSLNKLTPAYARVIRDRFQENGNFTFDILYGPPYKGTMLAPAVAAALETMMSNFSGCGPFRFCSSRKETKDHGEGGLLIGAAIRPGDHVLIIDDVITDGETKKQAVKFIREQGGEPVGLVNAFDRQEKGYDREHDVDQKLSAAQEFEQEYGIPVVAIATLNDLINVLRRQGGEGEILEKIFTYQREYGVS